MKLVQGTSLFFAIAIGFASFNAVAEDHGYVKHEEWKKGATIHKEDWSRGEQVDYKAHHLRTPPHGYEWRQVDGNYVLAAAATGVIASAIVASEVH